MKAALRDHVAAWGLTQAEAAKRLGISQPRLSELLKGRIGSFRLDRLTRLASKAGLKVEIKVGGVA